MAKDKKTLFKKCPSCGFKKCWIEARICENCKYDFKLERKPRTAKAKSTDDTGDDWGDIPAPVTKPEPPQQLHKLCPDCQNECWHKAPFCEKCKYDFKTGESQRKKEEREKKERDKDDNEPKVETRQQLGYRPFLSDLFNDNKPLYPWMSFDESKTTLSTWASRFISSLRVLLGVETIWPGIVPEYAEHYSPELRGHVAELTKMYSNKHGASEWVVVKLPNGMLVKKGSLLLSSEEAALNRKIAFSFQNNVAADTRGGFCMVPESQVESYRHDREKKGDSFILDDTFRPGHLRLVEKKKKAKGGSIQQTSVGAG